MTHTTAFVTPVAEHWLDWEIAQWVHHEGSIRWPIAPWANALTTEIHKSQFHLLISMWSIYKCILKLLWKIKFSTFVFYMYLKNDTWKQPWHSYVFTWNISKGTCVLKPQDVRVNGELDYLKNDNPSPRLQWIVFTYFTRAACVLVTSPVICAYASALSIWSTEHFANFCLWTSIKI